MGICGSPSDWDEFKERAKNPFFVGLILWIGLLGLAVLLPILWSFVFPMLLGFLIFDIVLNGFVRGRKIPLSNNGNEYKPKGWVFGIFLIGIIVASVLSALLSQWVANFLIDPNVALAPRLLGFLLADSFVVLVLWVDFETKVWNT